MSENVSSLERRVDVAVPVAELNEEVNGRLKRLARTVKMHGFRPGKVPLSVVAKQYGPQVQQEVLEAKLQQRFNELIKQQSLNVAGYPRFEAKPLEAGSENVEYSATFDVFPEVVIGDLASIKLTRPVCEVGAAEVDKTIEILRKQRATYVPADRAAGADDQVNIDYVGTLDGVPFSGGTATGATIALGQGRLLPEFEAAIVGMKAGEQKVFDLTFPADYHGKEMAGKTVQFDLKVNSVSSVVLPELNEAFAMALGIADGDVAKLRAEIEGNVGRETKRRISAKIKEQVMQALLDSTKLEIPKSLLEMEIQRLMESARQDLDSRGMKNMPISAEMFNEQARRRVSLGLILAEVVKANKLEAKPEQVRLVIEDFAENYEHPEEVVRWHYSSPERLADAESMAIEENVVQWVLGAVQVEDKAVTFEELMGN